MKFLSNEKEEQIRLAWMSTKFSVRADHIEEWVHILKAPNGYFPGLRAFRSKYISEHFQDDDSA